MGISRPGPGGGEEKKPSSMQFTTNFTSEQVDEALGDPNYLTESYLYHDQDVSKQDGVE